MADSLVSFTERNITGIGVVAAFGAGIWLLRRYLVGNKCTNNVSLEGKTVIITGGNCGIGKATAMELARRGARVILACRSILRGEKAAKEIRSKYHFAEVLVKQLDLASLASVRRFADEIICDEKRLDILINNAGVYSPAVKKTQDGFEAQFGINHLGHFLLTNLLLELLQASAPSRIVVVSSSLGKRVKALDFDAFDKEDVLQSSESKHRTPVGYGRSKLANFLFAHELSKRLPEGITVNSLCPGIVKTSLGRDTKLPFITKLYFYPLFFIFGKRPSEGMQTVIYCATEEKLKNVSGKSFSNCEMKELPEHCVDDGVSKKLWEVSEKLCGLA